ncbi:MAG: hypothetical protein ACI82G_003358, partial [Bradymonadia bacterium]
GRCLNPPQLHGEPASISLTPMRKSANILSCWSLHEPPAADLSDGDLLDVHPALAGQPVSPRAWALFAASAVFVWMACLTLTLSPAAAVAQTSDPAVAATTVVDPALDEAALVPVDYGAGPLPQSLLQLVTEAVGAERPLLSEESLSRRWSSVLPEGPDADRQQRFVRGTAQRDSGREAFFANDYDYTVLRLAPWLDAVEAEPAVLAFHPDLAPSVLESFLTLVRAYEVLGNVDAAEDALSRTAALFFHARLEASRYPPELRARFDDARALTPTRAVSIEVRGDDACDIRINANTVATTNGAISLPPGDHFLQLTCEGLPGRIHRIDDAERALQLDPLLDDAVRWSDRRVTLAPRSSTSLVVSRVVGAAAVRLSLGELYTAGVIESDVGEELMELVRTVPSEGTYRAARVRLPVDSAELHDALVYLRSGERRRAEMIVWSESGGWEGLVAERRNLTPWVAGSVTVLSVSTAVAFELMATSQHRKLERCAAARESADDCVLRGNLPRRRAAWTGARRRANALWGVAGGLTLVSATAIALSSRGRDRGAEVSVVPTRDSLYASLGLRF